VEPSPPPTEVSSLDATAATIASSSHANSVKRRSTVFVSSRRASRASKNIKMLEMVDATEFDSDDVEMMMMMPEENAEEEGADAEFSLQVNPLVNEKKQHRLSTVSEYQENPLQLLSPKRDDDWETMEDDAVSQASGDGGYYYRDVNDDTVTHGPFQLSDLKEWHTHGYFDSDMEIQVGGQSGRSVLLLEALADAGLLPSETEENNTGADGGAKWETMEGDAVSQASGDSGYYYRDADDDTITHGPFRLSELKEWYVHGHFESDMEIFCGKSGLPLRLRTVLVDAKLIAMPPRRKQNAT
jgi:hypothetical protein